MTITVTTAQWISDRRNDWRLAMATEMRFWKRHAATKASTSIPRVRPMLFIASSTLMILVIIRIAMLTMPTRKAEDKSIEIMHLPK
jgi:hypothetical protein